MTALKMHARVSGAAADALLHSDMPDNFAVYILASQRNGTLYIGVTRDLVRRVDQHKAKGVPGFTRSYDVTRLVYVERFQTPLDAIAREKQLKGWNRAWKIKLIEQSNPQWLEIPAD
jgi:putative endonuclease